jgi:hypothetical protein
LSNTAIGHPSVHGSAILRVRKYSPYIASDFDFKGPQMKSAAQAPCVISGVSTYIFNSRHRA